MDTDLLSRRLDKLERQLNFWRTLVVPSRNSLFCQCGYSSEGGSRSDRCHCCRSA